MLKPLFLASLLCWESGFAAIELSETLFLESDLRYRHEYTDDARWGDRGRHRIRARAGVYGEVTSNLDLGFRLAVGSRDPVSSNQTLGDSFSTKELGVDLAYFKWRPQSLELIGGKTKNPFHRPGHTELVWDSDLNPEGLSLAYSLSGPLSFSMVGAGYWVQEREFADDAWLFGGQVSVEVNTVGPTKLQLNLGYFDYVGLRWQEALGNPIYSRGNTSALSGRGLHHAYLYDYNLLNSSIEAKSALGQLPVAIYLDYARNLAVERRHTAWLVGVSAGEADENLSAALSYNYRWVQSDATVGAFSDSDFVGGGTDGKGHELALLISLSPYIRTQVSYFLNFANLEAPHSFHRLQADFTIQL